MRRATKWRAALLNFSNSFFDDSIRDVRAVPAIFFRAFSIHETLLCTNCSTARSGVRRGFVTHTDPSRRTVIVMRRARGFSRTVYATIAS